MAEIRSTLDMVMEKVAKMGEASGADLDDEEKEKTGMRLAATFMRGESEDLAESLAAVKLEDQRIVLKGMVRTLLRNIVLPRDEDFSNIEKAMHGLLQLGQGAGDLISIFSELKSILERYGDHVKQLQQQLREAFQQQMGQLEQALAQQTGVAAKLDPSQHPKFQEEWIRLKGELDNQYGRAVDQHKTLISQRLGC